MCSTFISPIQILMEFPELVGPKGRGMTRVGRGTEYPLLMKQSHQPYFIQSAKLDSLSCSNSFHLASCASSDSSKRQR